MALRAESTVPSRDRISKGKSTRSNLWRAFERAELLGHTLKTTADFEDLRIVDLFCGAGGLAVGAKAACALVGKTPRFVAAVDTDKGALELYRTNLAPELCLRTNANLLVDYSLRTKDGAHQFTYAPTIVDDRLVEAVGRVDVVIAGPPCQGHSTFNNKTRQDDPRNDLYVSAVAAAVALDARAIVIENVASVLKDRRNSVRAACEALEHLGYVTATSVLNAKHFGVSQNRRRHFMVAVKDCAPPLEECGTLLTVPERDLYWAIGDLEDAGGTGAFDSASELSTENNRRIKYLFDHKLRNLPNTHRPDCHKDGHSYPSVYGRLDWEAVSGTITQGFMSPGQGRFIHPSRPRTLTAHEAARIQGFSDSFDFRLAQGDWPLRNALTKYIGEAVPPWLGRVAVLSAILH